MDIPLRSSRQDDGGGSNNTSRYRFHSGHNRGGGRYHSRGGRRNRYHNNRGGRRHHNRHHHHHNHHHNYQNNRSYEPRNRVSSNNSQSKDSNSNTSNNNNTTMEKQLQCMIAKLSQSSNGDVKELSQNMIDLSKVLKDMLTGSVSENDYSIQEYIIDCVTSLPLYQEVYATFTVCMEQMVHDEFSKRCLELGCFKFQKLLKAILCAPEIAKEYLECKFLLRYFCYLARLGVVKVKDDEMYSDNNITLMQLIQYIVSTLIPSIDHIKAIVLVNLIMETVPYMIYLIPKEEIEELLDSLKSINYKSLFKPSVGYFAILLKEEIVEDDEDDGMDDDEDDDDEDEEQCCDSFQDSKRAIQSILEAENYYQDFSCISNQLLWNHMKEETYDGIEEGFFDFTTNSMLLKFDFSTLQESDVAQLAHPNLTSGIIYGRFPLFSPSDPDEDDEREQQQEANNPYVEEFTNVDKYFLHSHLRDVMFCYLPCISSSGIATGELSDIIDVFQSIPRFFPTKAKEAFEYGIVECLFGLLLQSNSQISFAYISRVLLQYVKACPATIPVKLVLSVRILLDDLLSSITPTKQCLLSKWLGYHLVNTDYQWPKALWDYWIQSFTHGKEQFILHVVSTMISYSDYESVSLHLKLPSSFDVLLHQSEKSKIQQELYSKIHIEKEDAANVATMILSSEEENRSGLVVYSILSPPPNTFLSDILEILKRYKPLLTVVYEKDVEDNLNPQESIMKTLELLYHKELQVSFFVLDFIVRELQKYEIFQADFLIKYFLGNKYNQWWHYIYGCICTSIDMSIHSKESAMDEEEEGKEKRVQIIISTASSLISAVISVIHETLVNTKFLSPNHSSKISLLEGLKYVLFHVQQHCYELLKEMSNTDVIREGLGVSFFRNEIINCCRDTMMAKKDGDDKSMDILLDCFKDCNNIVW